MSGSTDDDGKGSSELRRLLQRLSHDTTVDAEQFVQFELDADLDAYEREVAATLQPSSSSSSPEFATTNSSTSSSRSVDRVLSDVLGRMMHLSPTEERVACAVHAHVAMSGVQGLYGVAGLVTLLELCGSIVPAMSVLETVLRSAYESVVVYSSGSSSAEKKFGQHPPNSARDGWTTARHMVRAGLSLMSSRRRSTAAGGSISPPPAAPLLAPSSSSMMTARNNSSVMSTSRRATSRGSGAGLTPPPPADIVPPPAAAALLTLPMEKMFVSLPMFLAALRSIKRRQFDEVIAEAHERDPTIMGAERQDYHAPPPRGGAPPFSSRISPSTVGSTNNNSNKSVSQSAARSLEDVIEAILASQGTLPPSTSAASTSAASPSNMAASGGATTSPPTADLHASTKISEDLIDRFLLHKFGIALFSNNNTAHHQASDSDSELESSFQLQGYRQQSSHQFGVSASQGNYARNGPSTGGATSKQRFLNNIGPLQLLTTLSSTQQQQQPHQVEHNVVGRISARGPSIHVRSASTVDTFGGGPGMPRLWLGGGGEGDRSISVVSGDRSYLQGSTVVGGSLVASNNNSWEGGGASGGVRSSSVSPMPSGRTHFSATPRRDATPLPPPSLQLRPLLPGGGSPQQQQQRPRMYSSHKNVVEIDLEGSWTPENSTSQRPLFATAMDDDDDPFPDHNRRDEGSPRLLLHSVVGSSSGSPRGGSGKGGASSPLYGSTTSLKQMRKDSMIRKAQYNHQLAALKESILSKKMEQVRSLQQKQQAIPKKNRCGASPPTLKDKEVVVDAGDRQPQRRPQSSISDHHQRFHSAHGNKNIYALREEYQQQRQQSCSSGTDQLTRPPLLVSTASGPNHGAAAAEAAISVAETPSPSLPPAALLLPIETLPTSSSTMAKNRHDGKLQQHHHYQRQRCHSAGIRGPQIAMAIRLQAVQELEHLSYVLAL
ncbi:Hypothetical protein, putative [Bodo saltans]|uniref:Uncharacterized protein n=1 Tax=Bodo saltans TaxID=75058 RepID=A0A0S4IS81_BODSA|nr:Hypothetical protein, putative [Bodo saltans]|eukprot:CUE81393.1 Hypothetical protein, putative [Bodo saltans]